MVFYLLRRDDTLKVALLCSLMAPVVLLFPSGSGGLGFFILFISIVPLGIVLSVRLRPERRATPLETALPIGGRQILLVKMTGALLMIWLPLGVPSLLFVVVRGWAGWPTALGLLQGAAVLTLAALLPLAVRPRDAAIPVLLWGSLSMAGVAVGGLSWKLLPAAVHLACCAVLGAALFLRAWLAAPAAFEASSQEDVEDSLRIRVVLRTPAWWPIMRAAQPWAAIVLFFLGALVAGSAMFVFEFTLFVFQAAVLCRDRTRWLQALPLSHRALLWLTLATTAVPYVTGVAAGTWIFRPPFAVTAGPRMEWFTPGIDPRRDRVLYQTNVPLEFWRYAHGGRVPLIRAPWGETVRPNSTSILGFKFYNPYTATKANSRQFFEWQFENGTQALHGERIAPERYEQIGYYESPAYPGKNRVDLLIVATLPFWLLLGAYLREFLLSNSVQRPHMERYLILAPSLPILLWLCVELIYLPRSGMMLAGPLLQAFFMRIAELPVSAPALGAIALAPSIVLYILLEWQFARAETAGPLLPSLRGVR